MPAKLVKGQNADDVAAYVGYAAGIPGKDPFEVKAPTTFKVPQGFATTISPPLVVMAPTSRLLVGVLVPLPSTRSV